MIARHGSIGFLAALLLGSIAGADAPAGRMPTWRLLEKLLAQEDALPERPGAATEKPIPTERSFLFDEVLALEPAALLSGAAYVAVRNPASPDADEAALAAHGRRVNEELQAVFEYYPLIAKSPADFRLLTDAIRSGKQALALRHFLLRQCVPTDTPSSALSRYVRDNLADGAPTLQDDLMALVQNPTEDSLLQGTAIAVLGALVSDGFTWIIANDKEAMAHVQKTGAPVEVRVVLDAPDTIPLEKRSIVRLEQQRQRAGVIAGVFASIVRDESRPPALCALAESGAAALTQAYPLPTPLELPPSPPPLPAPLEN